jgi:alcohol dehydrogenase (cytochrome c)
MKADASRGCHAMAGAEARIRQMADCNPWCRTQKSRGARLNIAVIRAVLLSVIALEASAASVTPQESGASAAYLENCASCHGKTLGGALASPLKGDPFRTKWSALGLSALQEKVKSMPPANPGSLAPELYQQIIEQIQSANNMVLGEASTEGGGIASEVKNRDAQYEAVLARRAATLAALTSVSEHDLRDPVAEDWLSWRRTDDGHGYSPLTQINSGNASAISLAWSLTLPAGTNEITPLVHDGVMFLNSHGTILAIDSRTSDILWKYNRPTTVRQLGPPISQARGIAIFEDRLFVPTIDNHILALDIRTGKLLWDHVVSGMYDWMRFSSTPIVVHGKVIQGATGCWSTGAGGKCFVVALDAASGEEIWRFNTIPNVGEPGGDTWNRASYDKRAGAGVWSPGTYDPESNLVYFGTGQTYHIAALMRPASKRSAANSGLYTDSTLALNPDTGQLVWHYQHMARDVWDLDWAFERVLATLVVDSKPRRVVMTIGKIGILDVLDAKTGTYLFSHDLGFQNLVTAINPKTGWKTIDPAMDPDPKQPKFLCPFAGGVRNWPATSYDADKHLLFVGTGDSCMDIIWSLGEDFDISYNARPRPNGDGNAGGVTALNLLTRKAEWTQKRRAPEASATLSTAGGLVFEGSRDRIFRASDSASGEVLWHAQLDNVPSSAPITFASDGVQYVAVTTGGGNPNDAIVAFMTPEIDSLPPATTLWVFKLGVPSGPSGARTNNQ